MASARPASAPHARRPLSAASSSRPPATQDRPRSAASRNADSGFNSDLNWPSATAAGFSGAAAASLAARPRSASSFGGTKQRSRPQSAPVHRAAASNIGTLRTQFEALEDEARLLRLQIQEQERLLQQKPSANVENLIFNVKKELREKMDWSLHATISTKKNVANSSRKAQENSLFRREVQELRAACEYLAGLNLSMTKNPDVTIIEKKLAKVAKQFAGIASELREETEKREAIADVFGAQLDEVDEFIQKLWDLTKTMAAHRDDCTRLLKHGKNQVKELAENHGALMKKVKAQTHQLANASQAAAKLQVSRENDEAAIQEAIKQWTEKLQPLLEENKSLLKVTRQKEKEAEVLRNHNEQLLYALETYRKLCETEPKKQKVHGKHGNTDGTASKATKRPQSAAAHSSHQIRKSQ